MKSVTSSFLCFTWLLSQFFGLSLQMRQARTETLIQKEDNDLKENAENVCIDQQVKNQIINITYIQSQDVKDYTWCVKIPPRCVTYRTKLVTRYKQENVTRVVNVRSCCPGYEPDGKGFCQAVCKESCGSHGTCSEPEICRCDPGFSGEKCNVVGCPGGNWGPGCSKPCPCKSGGRCEAHTGQCICGPGWKGLHCQNKCEEGSWGLDCAETCQCSVGQRCHHVSGECLPCTSGTFGAQCANQCQCSTNGTALCLHTTGQCFCSPNWYGNTCELNCPFGYVDDVCHTSPVDPDVCICSSDQMICDHIKGCICKEDGDCGGGQRLLDLTRAAPLGDSETSNSHSSTVAIVLSVVFLTIATVTLVVLYYRRRMKRMEKDLANRSVYYVENSALDPGRHHNADLVISDRDPVDLNQDPILNTVFHIQNNVPNNLNDSLGFGATPRVPQPGPSSSGKAGKNSNIDRFKLGHSDYDDHHYSETATSSSLGACAIPDSSEDEAEVPEHPDLPAIKKFVDINVFEDELSPSKKKNNCQLDNSRKINKANVDLVFHRNNLVLSPEDQQQDNITLVEAENQNISMTGASSNYEEIDSETDHDDVAIAKMTAYLNQQ